MTSTAVIDPPETTIDAARVGYIDGLRQLADLLDQNPDLRLPYSGGTTPLLVLPHDDSREQVVAWARALPGTVEKDGDDDYFKLSGTLSGLHIKVIVDRPSVCERVVTSTETVTETVPDPDALALVPKVEVTREVETVEWKCVPLLSDAERAASPFGPVRKGLV